MVRRFLRKILYSLKMRFQKNRHRIIIKINVKYFDCYATIGYYFPEIKQTITKRLEFQSFRYHKCLGKYNADSVQNKKI